MMEKIITIVIALVMFDFIVAIAGVVFLALSWAIDEIADRIKKWRNK